MENNNIPQELGDLSQWINWTYGEVRPNGKRAKVPMIPGSPVQARINKPSNWTTFEVANQHDPLHLGFVLTKSDDLICIDLDHLVSDGVIDPWALEIIKYFDSYTEISPSGTGLHIWIKASLAGLDGRRKNNVEIYETARYLTVTGNHVRGTPLTIKLRQDHLIKFHESVFGDQSSPSNPPLTTPNTLMDDLWAGEWEPHFASQSEADLSFLTRIGPKVGWDPELVDRLFRSSGLMREKWDRPDYRVRTIAKAQTLRQGESQLRSWTLLEMKELAGDVEWLWKNWIPDKQITMIVGPPESGKSFFIADIIATLGGLRKWQDGTSPTTDHKGPVLLLETESMRDGYQERLFKMGAPGDGSMVRFVSGPEWMVTPQVSPKFFEDLITMAIEMDTPLIVVDSLQGVHDTSEVTEDMKKIITPFVQTASRLQIPVILVHHVRKPRENEGSNLTLAMVKGNRIIAYLCRSIIGMWSPVSNPLDLNSRVQMLKSSYCRKPPPFGLSVDPVTAALVRGTAPKKPKPPTKVEQAMDWEREFLGDGPQLSKDVLEEGQDAGHSERALKRAKTRLNIEPQKVGKVWIWELPSKKITIKQDGQEEIVKIQ